MSIFLALLFITFCWLAFVILGSAPLIVEDFVNPLPNDKHRGVSLLPGIPVFPIIACVIYFVLGSRGRQVTLWIHFGILIFAIIYAAYFYLKLAWLKRKSRS